VLANPSRFGLACPADVVGTPIAIAFPMQKSMVPWVLPMALFVVGNVLEGKLPTSAYPVAYSAKVLLVLIATIACGRAWKADLKLDRRSTGLGLLAGLIGIVAWLAIESIPYPHLGARTAFDPFTRIGDPIVRTAFLGIRFLGLAMLVPVIEEVFWRGFGLRFASDVVKPVEGGWRGLAIGSHAHIANLVVSVVFGLAHPEWLAGTVFAFGMGVLLGGTRSLGACVVAHATTNLLLGCWVIFRSAWALW